MALIVFTTFTMLTPPPELIATLLDDAPFRSNQIHERDRWLIEEAYKAGADQELEACCDTLQRHAHWDLAVCELMADRRPKPPSPKLQALKAISHLLDGAGRSADNANAAATIRRALEALDD